MRARDPNNILCRLGEGGELDWHTIIPSFFLLEIDTAPNACWPIPFAPVDNPQMDRWGGGGMDNLG